jgi:hypothetical protein
MLKHYQESLELAMYDFIPLMLRAKQVCKYPPYFEIMTVLWPEVEYVHDPYARMEALKIPDKFKFESFIMAMARKADTINMHKLNTYFKPIVEEIKERYNAPGGILKSDETETP